MYIRQHDENAGELKKRDIADFVKGEKRNCERGTPEREREKR